MYMDMDMDMDMAILSLLQKNVMQTSATQNREREHIKSKVHGKDTGFEKCLTSQMYTVPCNE